MNETTLDAKASDPITMGWMAGSPPPSDKTVRFSNGSMMEFPMLRYTFSNYRQFSSTVNVWRGSDPVSVLPRAERKDIDAVMFQPLSESPQAEPRNAMTWEQSLAANYTDGIVVLHKGRIVYERYFGALAPQGQHSAFSVTKSFTGLLGAMLVHEGTIDETALVTRYVPELETSAFGDATVRQVLDMTTGIKFSEDYADPQAEIWDHSRAGNLMQRPSDYAGPDNFYAYLQTIKKEGEHGQRFAYKTVNSDVLGWIIHRASGKPFAQLLQERIWSRLGLEQDAYLSVDNLGVGFAGGGLNASLRDMARFGEMMRLDGHYQGRQIVPKAVIDDIRRGGDKGDFKKADFELLPGWSYSNMWWVTDNENEQSAYSARGVYGQRIYIDPKAEMVIACFASFPMASNRKIDPTSLPAYQALAEHLIQHPG